MQEDVTTRRVTTQDLTGQTFNNLTVLTFAGYRKGTPCWECQCICGTIVVCQANNLKNSHTQSCGCLKQRTGQARTEDLTGKVFGRLTVQAFAGYMMSGSQKIAAWTCQCLCSNLVVAQARYLKNGMTQSCGCYKIDQTKKSNTTHGHRSNNTYDVPEYSVWAGMLRRCYNTHEKSYPRYGGRGIFVCERWKTSFEAFYEDMAPRPSPHHSLERINNDLGYSKENCIWATNVTQARNKRNNTLLTFNDRTQCLAAWAEELGMKQHTLICRLRRGWTVEDALTKSVAPAGTYHPRRNKS
jgi:hypothetical protein